jgi:GNAT superfamily N-acetyltransferase
VSDIEVRGARPDDYGRIADLTVDVYRALPGDHLADGYESEIRDVEGRARGAELLVALDGDTVVGSCTLATDAESPWLEWAEPDEIELRLLVVDPSARGRGIAQALVETCIERARELHRPIILHSTQYMTAAHRLYERLGFRRLPERDNNEVLPGYEFRAYRYDVQ